MTERVDHLVIGAGAAGLFYAGLAGQRGQKVLVLDHTKKPAEKVRISGGGRCNFTNLHTAPERFISGNPHFAKSALARFGPRDFLRLMRAHKLTWHEKTLGQLFCDQKAGPIIDMLLAEVKAGGGEVRLGTAVTGINHADGKFRVQTSGGEVETGRLVIATGGLSIPAMGATPFAYDVAEQFGHEVITPRPGLVPFTFTGQDKEDFASLAGVATPVRASAGGASFDEAMLFTHRGLSGPAMLQVSSYWQEGEPVTVDLFAGEDGAAQLKAMKETEGRKSAQNALVQRWPERLVSLLTERGVLPKAARMAEVGNKKLEEVAAQLSAWTLKPSGTEGWRTAEVTVGGIDTAGLSSKTMESRNVPGLYFIGEAVDVTGWLGGYNIQWAWASAHAAATG